MEDLARLQGAIRDALGKSRCQAAAYFGSIGKGVADELSDADLIVCCDHDRAELFGVALDEALRVVLYRPFDGREPSGRYWFAKLSPYAKLDVSFHSPAEYESLLERGGPFIDPPFQRVDFVVSPKSPGGTSIAPNTAEEVAFSKVLYKYQVGTKHALRGKAHKEDIEALDEELSRTSQRRVSDSVVRLYVDAKGLYEARRRGFTKRQILADSNLV